MSEDFFSGLYYIARIIPNKISMVNGTNISILPQLISMNIGVRRNRSVNDKTNQFAAKFAHYARRTALRMLYLQYSERSTGHYSESGVDANFLNPQQKYPD